MTLVTSHGRFAAFSTTTFNLSQTIGIITPLQIGERKLASIGYWRLISALLVLCINFLFTLTSGWLSPFKEGLMNSTMPVGTQWFHSVSQSIEHRSLCISSLLEQESRKESNCYVSTSRSFIFPYIWSGK